LDKVLIGEILYPQDGEKAESRRERTVRERIWGKIATHARRIPFAEGAIAAYYCALDPATPARARAILFAALAYFILPTDWVPDFLLGFGFSDDLAVLTAAIAAIRSNLRDDHYAAARQALEAREKEMSA
jgi:uncharacterized membrane protein YkvA (DUF1232 family)